jgi:regulator of protease activity HflC (stomatin/prohibitin superfamily)
MKRAFRALGEFFKRGSYIARAAAMAILLGTFETLGSRRGRRILGVLTLAGLGVGLVWSKPIRFIEPREMGLRTNRLTGGVSQLREGWVMVLPAIHKLRVFPLREQIYRPKKSARSRGSAPFQSVEGLSVGVDVTVRYALDPERIQSVALGLPEDPSAQLIRPVIDGVLHRTFARHTVREIFSSKRRQIEKAVRRELVSLLKKDGVVIHDVFLGHVDLPARYRKGLEKLLAEELRAEKMRYTLELKRKQVKQTALEAEAEKVRREKSAEAAGRERIIAARARAEAMKHVLPLKKKEIEQKRLEAEASRVSRVKLAHASAEARRIEAGGEADSRRKLAEAEAYRLDVTGLANSRQLAREGALVTKNPLLIQKTLADKLSDKIQIVIAPPGKHGFASGLLGRRHHKNTEAVQ